MDEITRCNLCDRPAEDGEVGGALASDEAWVCGPCSDWLLDILDQEEQDAEEEQDEYNRLVQWPG